LAILTLVGPSFVWCAEYIGSGEVILSTRIGSILGTGVIWAIVLGIVLKYWIGLSGARYTVCTGEGMIDMFARLPGPRNWAVWISLVAQFAAATISIGSIATAAGVFVNSILPLGAYWGGWLVTILAFALVWSGAFDRLKLVMTLCVAIIVIGVGYVAYHVFPDLSDFIAGLMPHAPSVPQWALEQGVDPNPWREILPLLGWGAGGFASQVWYTYWVLGAGYGMAEGRGYGQPADEAHLKSLTAAEARSVRGWCKVVFADATVAMVIGNVVTVCFLLAGAGVLGTKQLAPEGPDVGITLSQIFSNQWGPAGGFLFLLGGAVALIATQVGQLAGWPRLLADAARICIPDFSRKFEWRVQFRIFLVFFLITNMIIVFTLGYRPVVLVQLGAVLDGLLLTPLQAIWVGMGLYLVLPKLYSDESWQLIKPGPVYAIGLVIAFLVFGYFCVFQIPYLF
jgi:Mn2+/Fe2+ NRAMP family transporter